MGRALWLDGCHGQSLVELERAVDLSPGFAHGHEALAFVHCQSGDPTSAVQSSDRARHLSPSDPLIFSMPAARATALVRLGRSDEAAEWTVKAAARPNAHVHILGIAAYCLALAGRRDNARIVMASIRKRFPSIVSMISSPRFAQPLMPRRFFEGVLNALEPDDPPLPARSML